MGGPALPDQDHRDGDPQHRGSRPARRPHPGAGHQPRPDPDRHAQPAAPAAPPPDPGVRRAGRRDLPDDDPAGRGARGRAGRRRRPEPRHDQRHPAAAGHRRRPVRPGRGHAGPARRQRRPGRPGRQPGPGGRRPAAAGRRAGHAGLRRAARGPARPVAHREGVRRGQHPGQQGDLRPGLAGPRAAGADHLPGAARQPGRHAAGRVLHRHPAHQLQRGRVGPPVRHRRELGPVRRALRVRRRARRGHQGRAGHRGRPGRGGARPARHPVGPPGRGPRLGQDVHHAAGGPRAAVPGRGRGGRLRGHPRPAAHHRGHRRPGGRPAAG